MQDMTQHFGKEGASMRGAMAGVREEPGVGVPHPIAYRNTAMDTTGTGIGRSGRGPSRPVKPVALRNTSGAGGGPYFPMKGK